jgi:hypothetical protein
MMTNHVDLIIGTVDKKTEGTLRNLKRHTSKTMFEGAGKQNPNNETYQFWQQNNQPIGTLEQ